MKKAFSTLCCLDCSIPEIISLAGGSKMDAVELRVDDRLLGSIGDVSQYKQSFESHGIFVSNIASSIFIRDSKVPLLAEAYIDLAVRLGSKAVRVFGASDHNGVFDLSRIADGFDSLCEMAEKRGIEIWLETHSEFSTGKMCQKLVDTVRKSNLKLLWDVMHSIECGETIEETYALIGDTVSHVHLKDGYPSKDKSEYTLCGLGEGTFPFDEIVALLKQKGYDGCLSLEWETPWCPQLRGIYRDNFELLRKYNEILIKAGVVS